jgi:hypothetical protein
MNNIVDIVETFLKENNLKYCLTNHEINKDYKNCDYQKMKYYLFQHFNEKRHYFINITFDETLLVTFTYYNENIDYISNILFSEEGTINTQLLFDTVLVLRQCSTVASIDGQELRDFVEVAG